MRNMDGVHLIVSLEFLLAHPLPILRLPKRPARLSAHSPGGSLWMLFQKF